MFFLVYQIWWFLKDVFNEMLGFDAEGGSKIDAKSIKKSRPYEVAEKDAKMVPKASQKRSQKLSKPKKKAIWKANEKKIGKGIFLEPFWTPPPLPPTLAPGLRRPGRTPLCPEVHLTKNLGYISKKLIYNQKHKIWPKFGYISKKQKKWYISKKLIYARNWYITKKKCIYNTSNVDPTNNHENQRNFSKWWTRNTRQGLLQSMIRWG